jgi:pyruvate dehydrogenase complex dehydrogenase (E1) component
MIRRYPHTTQVAAKLSDADLDKLQQIIETLEQHKPAERHKAVNRSDAIRAAINGWTAILAQDGPRTGDPTWLRIDVDVAAQLAELASRFEVDVDAIVVALLNDANHRGTIKRELAAMALTS